MFFVSFSVKNLFEDLTMKFVLSLFGVILICLSCVVFGEKMLNYAVGVLWKRENIEVTIRYFTASGMMVNVVQHQQSLDCRFFEKNGKKLIF